MPTTTDRVQTSFVAYLGRPALAAELAYWQDHVDDVDQYGQEILSQQLAASDEFAARFAGLVPRAKLDLIFASLFNDKPTDTEAGFFLGPITNYGEGVAWITSMALQYGTAAQRAAFATKLAAAQDFTSTAAYGITDIAARNLGRDFIKPVHDDATLADARAQIVSRVAYAGSLAWTGGDGAEVVIGGDGGDTLAGAGGDDRFDAVTGNDVVDGGAGTDTLYVSGNAADYAYSMPNPSDTLLVDAATGEHITVRNVEYIVFNDRKLSVAQIRGQALPALPADVMDQVQHDYVAYLSRPATGPELQAFTTRAVFAGYSKALDELRTQLTTSPEFADRFAGLDVGAKVDLIQKSVFNDLPDADSRTFYSTNPLSGYGSALDWITDMILLLGNSKQDHVFANKLAAANAFSAAIPAIDDAAGHALARQFVADVHDDATLAAALVRLQGALAGGDGNDALTGTAAANLLFGGAGDDTLQGGGGNDVFDAGTGDDVVDGGAGTDTLYVSGNAADYQRFSVGDADTLLVDAATGERILMRSVENVVFRDGTKSLAQVRSELTQLGTDGNDTLDGRLGNFTLAGGTGNDRYIVDGATDKVIELPGEGIDDVQIAYTAAGKYVLPDNVENATVTAPAKYAVNVQGNALDNTLTGNGAVNALYGEDGNDTLDGGAGADTLTGGAGDDVYVVDNAGDKVVELPGAGNDRVYTTLASYGLANEVEQLIYKGGSNFVGKGNGGDNRIEGGAGSDRLSGLSGADTLVGKAGNDTLDGGDGDDHLDAGTGTDTVDGGAGSDTLYVLGNFSDYVRSRPTLLDTLLVNASTGERIQVRNVEQIAFADGTLGIDQVNAGLASPGNDTLAGTDANDSLDGGLGSDTLAGGKGDDTYTVNVATDKVVELQDEGHDTVIAAFTASGTWMLPDHVEDATVPGKLAVHLTGNALDNVLTGNGAANTLLGGAGNDTLDGQGGKDKLAGGAGDDLYIVETVGDAVTEAAGEGTDTVAVLSLASYTLTANVENLNHMSKTTFTGTGNALGNRMRGDNGNDKLSGLGGDDQLFGQAGNDTLLGGDGNDLLDAGQGVDVVDGGAGDDTLQVLGNFADYVRSRPTTADTQLVNAWTGENIVLRNVEHVQFFDGTVDIAVVRANTASPGGDSLSGTDGIDFLDGGLGSDTLVGGKGDDTYVVNAAADKVVELADEGTDLVQVAFTSGGTWLLGSNVENAIVTSGAKIAVNLTGNALDNILTGNAAANTLQGGAGADILTGGEGKDVFVLDSADGVDTVADFRSGTDQLRVSQKAFHVGNSNTKIDGAVLRAAPGGFSAKSELVIFTQKIDGDITADSAAAAIGEATGAYVDGTNVLFVVSNASGSTAYLFNAQGADAVVSADELTEVASLVGTPAMALKDIVFGA